MGLHEPVAQAWDHHGPHACPRYGCAHRQSVSRRHDVRRRLFRASNEFRSLLTLPREVMARPGLVDGITEVAGAHEAVVPPGPSREELLDMLG